MIPASKGRLLGVAVVVMALLATLCVRLWYVQVDKHSYYTALANADRVRDIVEPPVRGEIVSDNGQPMVTNTSSLTVSVNMAVVGQESDGGVAELARLAKLLGLSDQVLREKVRICTVGVKPPCWPGSPYQPIPVAEHVRPQVAVQVLESKQQFPGVTADVQPQVSYAEPISEDASQLLGYLQPITAQEVKQLHIPITGFSGVDLVGQAGLEAQYDSELRGVSGQDEVAVNAGGQVTSTIKNTKPVAGDDLVTSINEQVQEATENALRDAIQRTQAEGNSGATSGAAVVMTTTGRIVAMASYPTYNPSIWANGINQRQFNQLFGTGDGEPVLERATQGEYPPGSTWKVTTLTAAVDNGYSLYSDYDCPASTDVGGHVFNNDFGNGGMMSLHQALVLSCDTVFYNFGYDLWLTDNRQDNIVTNPNFPIQKEMKTELEWGFGKNTGIDIPGENRGSIPTREWLYYYWKDNAHTGQDWCKYGRQNGSYVQQIEYDDCTTGNYWLPGQAIIASIGQGYVTVTPLQLASAYAALANGGTLYSPRIGEALLSPTGKVVQHINPPVLGHLPASGATLAYIRSALQGVITSGTAAGTFGGFPLGKVCVAGKTGTAQVFGKNSTSNFASFAPCNNPKYVVVMMIPDSGYGADVSGPAVRQIWDAIYGLEGHKAALPGGVLPALPRVNTAGQIVPSTSGQLPPAKKTR
ncbi:MAG TPA: penicillin-binding protein 2 [Streptosporangiaceae bacterium]|nr:penicillin-binding protein 2 [Streptosporangiaceae bacterium]